MIKAKDLLKFAEKKSDPGDATLKECANIAAKSRSHVWEGAPIEDKIKLDVLPRFVLPRLKLPWISSG